MFVVFFTYKKAVSVIDNYIVAHRNYLDECYENNYFIVSGPKIPRDGGVIISQLSEKDKLESILMKDPLVSNDLVDVNIIEMSPTKYHKNFCATFK